MLIKNVPYIGDRIEKFASCQGPPSVLMVYLFFRPNSKMTFQRLYRELEYQHATWFFEVYIARFFHKKGINVKYFSTVDTYKIGSDGNRFNRLTGLNIKSIKDRDEVDIKNYDSAVDYSKKHNLFKIEQFDLDLLKDLISKKNLIIATVNRNTLEMKEGYKGHFIVVKGYDEQGFICNDAYLGENINIEYSLFRKAFFNDNDRTYPEADFVVVGQGVHD